MNAEKYGQRSKKKNHIFSTYHDEMDLSIDEVQTPTPKRCRKPGILSYFLFFLLYRHRHVIWGSDNMSQGYFDVSEHVPNKIFMSKWFFRALSDQKWKLLAKNHPKFWFFRGNFLPNFREQNSFLLAESAQKWFSYKINVENVFSNINLTLELNIKAIHDGMGRTERKTEKKLELWHF